MLFHKETDELLYIGLTCQNVEARLHRHLAKGSNVRNYIDRHNIHRKQIELVEVQWSLTKEEAFKEERRLIQSEHPTINTRLNRPLLPDGRYVQRGLGYMPPVMITPLDSSDPSNSDPCCPALLAGQPISSSLDSN